MDEINPLSKFPSPLISYICGEDTISARRSFAVQSRDRFRSWDHLMSNLGIICSIGIICRSGSFAGPYSTNSPFRRHIVVSHDLRCKQTGKVQTFKSRSRLKDVLFGIGKNDSQYSESWKRNSIGDLVNFSHFPDAVRQNERTQKWIQGHTSMSPR